MWVGPDIQLVHFQPMDTFLAMDTPWSHTTVTGPLGLIPPLLAPLVPYHRYRHPLVPYHRYWPPWFHTTVTGTPWSHTTVTGTPWFHTTVTGPLGSIPPLLAPLGSIPLWQGRRKHSGWSGFGLTTFIEKLATPT